MLRLQSARRWWVFPPLVAALALTTFGPATASTSGDVVAPPQASPSATNCGPFLPLDRKAFPQRPRIDNRFMPLVPGMQFTLSGDVLDGQNNPHPHQIITTVTDLTKVIDGVRSMVIQDVDVQDSVIIESEIFFVAQDRKGTVWTLGEYPEEYVNGQLDGAPSTWLSGVDGAHAGIAMLAKPKVGTPTYLQGLAPTVGFKDCATVLRIANRQCVTSGCYHDILVTDEFAPLDPTGGHQRKLYAAGVGAIKVGAAGGIDPETLQLTKAGPLCKADFAAVRQQALAQDVRGYTVAADVYGGSPHAKDTLDAKTC